MLENEGANKFGIKLDNYRESGGLLGWQGEGIHESEVYVGIVRRRDVTIFLGFFDNRQGDLLEHDVVDLGGVGRRLS